MTAFGFRKPKPAGKKNRPVRKRTNTKDLVDPISYIGDLDPEKYPSLSQDKEEKMEEEIENPLNQR